MKKIIFSLLTLSLLTSLSFAECSQCSVPQNSDCACPTQKLSSPTCQEKLFDKIPCDSKGQSKGCSIDDDEYCTYNECYFDKKFVRMKKELCLTPKQETCIDTLYKNFKNDMEVYHSRYRTQKNRLLEMIECNNSCYKEQEDTLKELQKDFKDRCKLFKEDIKELLCKEQYNAFKKFQKEEKKKMKKLFKYSSIHKLPCCDCCSK